MKQVLLFGTILAIGATAALAAAYTYKCPNCGLIQQYDHPGIYKCPKDQWILVPVK